MRYLHDMTVDTPSNEARATVAADKGGRPTIFVISPIGTSGSAGFLKAKTVLTYIIKKAFPQESWEVIRADDEASPDSITRKVIDRIHNSDYIVADLSDHNPNVFYELAVAHGYQKRIITLIEAGQSIPFDVNDQRTIDYDLTDPASVDSAIKRLIASQRHLEGASELPQTPLTNSGAFTAISGSHPSEASNAAIADALQDISTRLTRMERGTVPIEPPTGKGLYREGSQKLNRDVEHMRGLNKELRTVNAALAVAVRDLAALPATGADADADVKREALNGLISAYEARLEDIEELRLQAERHRVWMLS